MNARHGQVGATLSYQSSVKEKQLR
jgi:hypothetical protein